MHELKYSEMEIKEKEEEERKEGFGKSHENRFLPRLFQFCKIKFSSSLTDLLHEIINKLSLKLFE